MFFDHGLDFVRYLYDGCNVPRLLEAIFALLAFTLTTNRHIVTSTEYQPLSSPHYRLSHIHPLRRNDRYMLVLSALGSNVEGQCR